MRAEVVNPPFEGVRAFFSQQNLATLYEKKKKVITFTHKNDIY